MARISKSKIKVIVLKIMEDTFGVPSHSVKGTDSISGDLFIEGADFQKLIEKCNREFTIKIRYPENIDKVNTLINSIKSHY